MIKSQSALDTWLTPRVFYNQLDNRFHFDDFDPCPPDCDLTKFNGLNVSWAQTNFVNPPYSRLAKEAFINKAYYESLAGKTSVLLLPVSTSTKIFHDLIHPKAKIEFVKGRLKFEGIDRDGNWVNPYEGMTQLKNVLVGARQLIRCGQQDLMLVIFGDKNDKRISNS